MDGGAGNEQVEADPSTDSAGGQSTQPEVNKGDIPTPHTPTHTHTILQKWIGMGMDLLGSQWMQAVGNLEFSPS